MAPKKVALKSIKSLTFYKESQTTSRRTTPIAQLTCNGKACRQFQPDVVQCLNTGDDGLGGAQWKCETDLPRGLRLGKVHVSCEGWSKAGDPNVLQGSCGLEYDLHTVNRGLEYGEDPHLPSSKTDIFDKIFYLLYGLFAFILIYSLFRSCVQRVSPRYTPPPLSRFWPGGGGGGGGWGGGGGGPGFGGGGAPPPYTKYTDEPSPSIPNASGGGLGMGGFWTGVAAGTAGSLLVNRLSNSNFPPNPRDLRRERELYEYTQVQRGGRGRFDDVDRGEGSSTGLRRATGFGGSSTR